MRSTLIAVGKAKAPFVDDEQHYLKLLRRHLPLELVIARDDADLLRRIPERSRVVALDEQGKARDSEAWARWLEERRHEGTDLCFLVGGREGLPGEALDRADERVSFGPQAIAHQLARIVLLEQLFRATKITAGEPYHC